MKVSSYQAVNRLRHQPQDVVYGLFILRILRKKKPNYVVWRKCGKPKNVWWGNVKKNKYYIM